MKTAVLSLLLVALTTTVSSQRKMHIAMQDGRATCYDLDVSDLKIGQSKTLDWLVMREDGLILATVPDKEDAEAVAAVIKRQKPTAICMIGKADRTFKYFESAR